MRRRVTPSQLCTFLTVRNRPLRFFSAGHFAPGGNAGNFDRTHMATDGTASTGRGPGGVFASHGGQLGTDTSAQGAFDARLSYRAA